MKKLLAKDKKVRKNVKNLETKKLILQTISSNLNLPNLLRFNAFSVLNKIFKKASKILISNRCINTINKKKFNNLTRFSRIVFLKLSRKKKFYGLGKISW